MGTLTSTTPAKGQEFNARGALTPEFVKCLEFNFTLYAKASGRCATWRTFPFDSGESYSPRYYYTGNIGQKPVLLEFPSTLMEQRTLDARGVLGNSSTTTLELRLHPQPGPAPPSKSSLGDAAWFIMTSFQVHLWSSVRWMLLEY